MLAAGRGTDPGEKFSFKPTASLQILVLDHFWMRFQLSQVGDLFCEDMGKEVLGRKALPRCVGKVAFHCDAGVAGGKMVSCRRVVNLS